MESHPSILGSDSDGCLSDHDDQQRNQPIQLAANTRLGTLQYVEPASSTAAGNDVPVQEIRRLLARFELGSHTIDEDYAMSLAADPCRY